MTQIGQGIDTDAILNAINIPDDAGEHADALRRMLARIPDGWGRWIGCSRGWYPILVELDEQLQALFPDYELHQVKEKYGGLRFYWSSGERVSDPTDPEPAIPDVERTASEAEKDAAWTEWESAHNEWCERLENYLKSEDGTAREAAFEHRSKLAEQLVQTAQQRASVTCELCGLPGERTHTRGPCPWYQTLCPACARERGYVR